MRIQPAQSYSYSPKFQSAYPVVHWVAEKNGSYAPAVSLGLNKKLQRKLVSILNKTSGKNVFLKNKYAGDYLAGQDSDYKENRTVRSYYNNHGGWSKKFNPISYLISGSDVEAFDAKYGKAIGVSKSQAPFDGRQKKSAELNEAVRNYAIGGLRFVTDKHKGIYDSTGIGYALHTKFQTIRNKNGKIKGYEFVDLKFCPEEGPENPFVRVGLIKP